MNTQETLNAIIDTQNKRLFRFQKSMFCVELEYQLKQAGYNAILTRDKYNGIVYQSLIIGDVKQSKQLLITHYDTPSFFISLFKYKSFDMDYRKKLTVLNDILKGMLVTAIVSSVLYFLIKNILAGNNVLLFSILSLILFLLSVLFIRLPGFIPSSKYSNNQSIKKVIEEYINHPDDVSIILVEDGCGHQMGYQMISQSLKKRMNNKSFEIYDQSYDSMSTLPNNTILNYFKDEKVKLVTIDN